MAVVAHPQQAAHDVHVQTQTHAEVTRDVVATLGPASRGYVLLLFGAVSLFLIGILTFPFCSRTGWATPDTIRRSSGACTSPPSSSGWVSATPAR